MQHISFFLRCTAGRFGNGDAPEGCNGVFAVIFQGGAHSDLLIFQRNGKEKLDIQSLHIGSQPGIEYIEDRADRQDIGRILMGGAEMNFLPLFFPQNQGK